MLAVVTQSTSLFRIMLPLIYLLLLRTYYIAHLEDVVNLAVENAHAADFGVVGDADSAEGVVGLSRHGAGAARAVLVRIEDIIPIDIVAKMMCFATIY
jgi:hypothetical protein